MIPLYLGLGALLALSLGFVIVPLWFSDEKTMLNGWIKLVICLFIVIVGISGYSYWGHRNAYKDFLQQQRAVALLKDPDKVIQVLQTRVTEKPSDSKAWYLLGQVYFSNERLEAAATAFAKAHVLDPEDQQTIIRYAVALYFIDHKQLTKRVQNLVQQGLQQDPTEPELTNLLAMHAYHNKRYQEAMHYWQTLLPRYLPDSEDAKLLQAAIEKAKAHLTDES